MSEENYFLKWRLYGNHKARRDLRFTRNFSWYIFLIHSSGLFRLFVETGAFRLIFEKCWDNGIRKRGIDSGF